MTVTEIAKACGAETVSGLSDIATFSSISTDSRTVCPGDLFVALRGSRYDGHNFLTSAVDKGAMGIIAARDAVNPFLKRIPKQFMHVTLILVDDTLKAYQNIARLACRKIGAKVVAVTGSTGKTTTKDMIASILEGKGKTVASPENFNNEVGLPATILAAGDDTAYMVLEMGMRGPGQIAELARIARPHVGVITNIGLTHYELLGSAENIASAKAELAAGVRENGWMVLNAADAWSEKIKKLTTAKILTFGTGKNADVMAGDIMTDSTVRASFRLKINADGETSETDIRLDLPGLHNVENALAASTACFALGATMDEIKAGLEKTAPPANRMNIIITALGTIIIDDTYNASPTSMSAAIDALLETEGVRKIAVLGDMLELGEISSGAHTDIGKRCAEAKIDLLVTTGERALDIAAGAVGAGMPEAIVRHVGSVDEAAKIINTESKPGDVVLVKASRALAFERIVECIK
jgi:UDP-N-acetylmuramoyl-tripeptide--D-alanyl-D-alanine ligase